MKTVCIYHSIDLDGWMSAAIVKHWWNLVEKSPNDKLSFIGYNYGEPIPDLSEYDKVIMCDISFDNPYIMYNIAIEKELTWLDHHISAIDLIENYDWDNVDSILGIRDTNFAASELTWKYFFPNEEMPEIVRLLGMYDSFRHRGTDEEQRVLEFQYGARQVISKYEEAYIYLVRCTKATELLRKNIQNSSPEELKHCYPIEKAIHEIGVSIYKYLCTEAKQVYKNGFEAWFNNGDNTSAGCTYKFICVNKERFNPISFGIDYHKEGYDGAACFHYGNGVWNFGLYNDNGLVDCSQIAKQYGGGGHRGSSGMRLNNTQFLQFING